jgi:hypothetical protein
LAADAGFAGFGSSTPSDDVEPTEIAMAPAQPEPDFGREWLRQASNLQLPG